MKSLRTLAMAGACAIALAGCANLQGGLATAATDVANTTATVVKAAPAAVSEASAIGASIATFLGDVANLLASGAQITF